MPTGKVGGQRDPIIHYNMSARVTRNSIGGCTERFLSPGLKGPLQGVRSISPTVLRGNLRPGALLPLLPVRLGTGWHRHALPQDVKAVLPKGRQ